MHYYQFNIADYRKDTTHLSPIEHYIYRELIDWYYLDEKPIPLETQLVIRRLRLTDTDTDLIQLILTEFFTKTEKGYQHERIDTDISAYQKKADTARANGSKGGRPRNPEKTKSVNLANQEKTGSKANHKPKTNNKYTSEFIEFWDRYPRKENKAKGFTAWRKLTDSEKNLAMDDCVKRYEHTDVQFVPHPSSYLNGKRWEDEKPVKKTVANQDWI